jgi:ABC-type molybdate transport system substrate-binding protein
MWSWVFPVIGPERYEQIPIPPEFNVIDPVVAIHLNTARNRAGAEKLVGFLQTERAQKLLAEARLARPK